MKEATARCLWDHHVIDVTHADPKSEARSSSPPPSRWKGLHPCYMADPHPHYQAMYAFVDPWACAESLQSSIISAFINKSVVGVHL